MKFFNVNCLFIVIRWVVEVNIFVFVISNKGKNIFFLVVRKYISNL